MSGEAGSHGFRTLGEAAAEMVADVRFRALVRRLHGKGPRVLAEFLAALAAERSIMTAIEQKLERYERLTPEMIAALLPADDERPQRCAGPAGGPEAA